MTWKTAPLKNKLAFMAVVVVIVGTLLYDYAKQ